MLRDWDIQINRILKAKGRLPYTSSPTALHTSKLHGRPRPLHFCWPRQGSLHH
jgi:hypothetical protein